MVCIDWLLLRQQHAQLDRRWNRPHVASACGDAGELRLCCFSPTVVAADGRVTTDCVFLTFVSLTQDIHSDQVQRSKCNTATLFAPLQAGLETETRMELVLCVSTAKQLVPKAKLLLFAHYKT